MGCVDCIAARIVYPLVGSPRGVVGFSPSMIQPGAFHERCVEITDLGASMSKVWKSTRSTNLLRSDYCVPRGTTNKELL